MSEMFDGIDTETLRALHRQIGAKAMAVFTDAAAAVADATLFGEIMDYGRQLHSTVCLIGTELEVRHAIYVSAAAERAAALHAPEWHCMGCGADYDGDASVHVCIREARR
jgi:hypothetical protein